MKVKGYEIKQGANLRYVDLQYADLQYADLRYTNLRHANLRYANLRGADLRDADLRYAILQDASLQDAKLPHFKITPEEGSFIGWKKTDKGVVKLLVTEDAKRTNSLVGRKCRASKVKVLEGSPGATGTRYGSLVYETGATLEVKDFDDDIRVACTTGIHFFMTRQEAEEWS